jgi:hypothetical protein
MHPSRERALAAGCAACVTASARALCCLPWIQGYHSPSPPAAEQSLLPSRPMEAPSPPPSLERPSGSGAATTAPERPLLPPKGAPRSDVSRKLDLGVQHKEREKEKGLYLHRKSASLMSLGDDDALYCPTCLEAYTKDNPKVTAACGHSFHLPCIYEWLERSPTCPVCGRKMEAEGLVEG